MKEDFQLEGADFTLMEPFQLRIQFCWFSSIVLYTALYEQMYTTNVNILVSLHE